MQLCFDLPSNGVNEAKLCVIDSALVLIKQLFIGRMQRFTLHSRKGITLCMHR